MRDFRTPVPPSFVVFGIATRLAGPFIDRFRAEAVPGARLDTISPIKLVQLEWRNG